jgi:hypothetical protein
MFQNFCRLWSVFWNRQEILKFIFIFIPLEHRILLQNLLYTECLQHTQYEHMMTTRISELAKLCKIIVDTDREVLDSFEFICDRC